MFEKKVTKEKYNKDMQRIAEVIGISSVKDGEPTAWSNIRIQNKTLAMKLDLILDHLNLTYQPEQSKTESAKLVEKERYIDIPGGSNK